MSLSEIAVLILIAAGMMVFTRRVWRMGARGWRLAVAWSLGFLGLVLVTTMTAHILEILLKLFLRSTPQATAFRYDFRAYSLLLLGVLLGIAGLLVLRSGSAVGCDGGTVMATMRNVVVVLLVVVPLIPIQAFFAVPLTIIAGVCLTLILVSKASLTAERAAEPARSP